MGNLKNFLNRSDSNLQKFITSDITCDVSVNYIINNNRKSQLDAVLHSYNLMGIVKFPTIIGLNSHTANDNVFMFACKTKKGQLE
jgi:hypothetical protein